MLEEEYQICPKLRKAIESTYENCECKVRTGFENKRWFKVRTGVKQGSVLSPILFIAYLDCVIKKVKDEVQDLDGDIMAYADDLACWSQDREKLGEVIRGFAEKLKEAGLSINVEKTEVLIVGRGKEREEFVLEVEGEEVKMVERCKYLGGVFTREGGNLHEITSRMEKYGVVVRMLYPILADRRMNIEVKKVIFESILTPILIFSAETWSATTREESRIQAAEMRVLRLMEGKTRRDRIRNERIRESIGVNPIIHKMDAA